jgi:hypothetical protein
VAGRGMLASLEQTAAGAQPDRPSGPPPSPDPNFTPAAQNGFAARLQWSVTPAYEAANHEPTVSLQGRPRLYLRAGDTVRLKGVVADPDDDAVSVKWWQWTEVGTYPGEVWFSDRAALDTDVRVPADAERGQTIQLVLEATDDGTPPLTRYQRMVLTVAN